MVLVLNGIPVFAFELKNQYTGQTVDNAKQQWMYDRDPRETCFQFNRRILAFFCVDHTEVWMTTKLAGKNTYFLPFNQGSKVQVTMAAKEILRIRMDTLLRIFGKMFSKKIV